MSKHTKGPWSVASYVIWPGYMQPALFPVHAPKRGRIATASRLQDARLIAAAPDLLDFAEEVRRNGDTRLASMAIALIAKATGK